MAASLEVLPQTVLKGDRLLARIDSATAVYVPYLPGADIQHTIAACARLVALGAHPVPHLPARAMPSRDALDSWLGAISALGVDSLMLVGGDQDRSCGPFHSVLDVLDCGLLLTHGQRRLGITGYPDGHPRIPCAVLEDSLLAKQAYAQASDSTMWVVTQFAFEQAAVLSWLRRAAAIGMRLPVWIGLAGPAQPSTLLAYALRCGVRASSRALTHPPAAARRLLRRWSPHELWAGLVGYSDETSGVRVAGPHIFPFGGLGPSLRWLKTMRAQATAVQQAGVSS